MSRSADATSSCCCATGTRERHCLRRNRCRGAGARAAAGRARADRGLAQPQSPALHRPRRPWSRQPWGSNAFRVVGALSNPERSTATVLLINRLGPSSSHDDAYLRTTTPTRSPQRSSVKRPLAAAVARVKAIAAAVSVGVVGVRLFSMAVSNTPTMLPSSPAPYAAYAGIMATFLGGIAATGLVTSRLRRTPVKQSWLDLAVLGLATFKASRTLARDEVTSFIREPFVQGTPTEAEQEMPVQDRGPPPSGWRARDVLSLRRYLGRGRHRGGRRPRASLRPYAQLGARGRRRKRLPPGRVLGSHWRGERPSGRLTDERAAPRAPRRRRAPCPRGLRSRLERQMGSGQRLSRSGRLLTRSLTRVCVRRG